MATLWQYPRTYTAGELVTSSHMNREIRDNMRASVAVLSETVLTTSTAYIVSLSAPSTMWNNWQVIASCAQAQSASFQFLIVSFNTDLSSVYQSVGLSWIPTSTATAGGNSTGYVTGGTVGAGFSLPRPPNVDRAPAMGTYRVDIPAVNSTRYKCMNALAASPWSSAYPGIPQLEAAGAIWRSTAAITSVDFRMDMTTTVTFLAGSVFTLIGYP